MITRRNILKGLLGTSLAGLLAGIYGGFVEPDLRMRVQNWALQPEGWPRGRRLRLVMLADLHAGWPNMSVERVQAAVDLANAQGGDLILLMGDYRATHKWQIDRVPIEMSAPLLAGLKAPLGVYAVLGNHDWWDHIRETGGAMGPTRTQKVLENLGIAVLANRAIRLEGFWLAGLDSQAALLKLRGHRRDCWASRIWRAPWLRSATTRRWFCWPMSRMCLPPCRSMTRRAVWR